MNYLEITPNIVHTNGADGNDYTLCGLTSEKLISEMSEYDRDREDDLLPYMMETTKKITCPKCAEIIRYCCALGKRSIGKVREAEDEDGGFY